MNILKLILLFLVLFVLLRQCGVNRDVDRIEKSVKSINNIVDYSNEASWSIDPSSNEIRLNENMMYKLFKEMMDSNKELIASMMESNHESTKELITSRVGIAEPILFLI